MGFYDDLQKIVNFFVGNDYRKIYFNHYPGPQYLCKACGKKINRNKAREVHIDHIVPQSLGGTNALTNLQVLCAKCNIRKSDTINTLSIKYSGYALLREINRVLGY